MDVRVQELFIINNKINVECEKMVHYLQIIKEKSNGKLSLLSSLKTADFLLNYARTCEYLNKFYYKLLEQNCMFELLFLELNEMGSDTVSNYSHTNHIKVENISLDQKLIYGGTQVSNNLTSNKLNTDAIINTISSLPRSKNNMNVNAKEFYPQSTISSSNDVVIEDFLNTTHNSETFSLSTRSQNTNKKETLDNEITKQSSCNYAANISPCISKLSIENVAQHNLQNSNSNISVFKEESIKSNSVIEKEILDKSTSNNENNRNEVEKLHISEKNNSILDVKNVFKKLDDKQKELNRAVYIPDLRPVVVKKAINDSISIPTNTSEIAEKNTEISIKSTEHAEKKKDNILQRIDVKRGTTPKEGDLCCISSIESPSSFYIHLIRDDNALMDTLSQQIAEVSNSLKSFHNKKAARKCIDIYCVCYINVHSSWCRVEVTNWMMEHKQLIEVRLIDYGLSCKVPLINVREANQYFFLLPIMAEKCKLAWIKPINEMEEWSTVNINYFNNLINKTNRIFTISYLEEENNILSIDLQNKDIQSIAGLLVNDGEAVIEEQSDESKKWSNTFMRKQIVKSQGFTEEEFNQAEEDRLEAMMFDNEDDEEVDNPMVAVSHYNPKDESRICRIFLSRGYCFKEKNCPFSHSPLNPDGWTTDREAVFFDAFNHLQLPPAGSEITVKIIQIIDLRCYYVVIKDIQECAALIGMPVNNIRSLVKLMNDPEEVKLFKKFTVVPALGEIILVHYKNQWQRGRVVNMEEYAHKVELEVMLVDFGVIEKFNMKNCRNILEKHLYLPFQVVMCSLCNVTMKENLSETENEIGSDYLEMHVENKKLKAKVMYSAFSIHTHLYTENGLDVGEELYKAGLVNKCAVFTSIPTDEMTKRVASCLLSDRRVQ